VKPNERARVCVGFTAVAYWMLTTSSAETL
jgi:hypothetical protein